MVISKPKQLLFSGNKELARESNCHFLESNIFWKILIIAQYSLGLVKHNTRKKGSVPLRIFFGKSD